MKNAIILHGTNGHPTENWFDWLKKELEQRGWNVHVPQLPDANEPNTSKYNDFLINKEKPNFNQDTVLIGHSSGAVAILGLLDELPINKKVNRCYLVGSFKNDLDWDSLKGLFENELDFEKIKKMANKFVFIHSDNDPYCPLDHAKELSKKLNGDLFVKKGQKHFSVGTMGKIYEQFPFLLKAIMKDQDKYEGDERFREKIEKLMSGKAKKAFSVNSQLPTMDKSRNKLIVNAKLKQLDPVMKEIESLFNGLRKYVGNIWDQDERVASYLLLGRSISNLKVVLSLAKQGKCIEMVDLSRSAHEAIDLIFLFLTENGKPYMNRWFAGETIDNSIARKELGKLVNEINQEEQKYNEMKSKVYKIYSMYAHSNYRALFDSIDVFREDFDFDGVSGFHYTNSYFQPIVIQLVINILFALKNIYAFTPEEEAIRRIDRLLPIVGHENLSPEQIKEIINKENIG